MNKLTLGVVGLGEGRSIISAALASKMWQLGNICDLNESLCQQRLDEFNLQNYTTSYNEMLEDPDIDVIGIYTPDHLHSQHIKLALKAGKHVICTKPLMTSLDEANELLEIQSKSGKQVFVGQSSRYFEPMIRQNKDYEDGNHGELVTVETQYVTDGRWFLEKPWTMKGDFSWMYGFMIHAVDLAVWYLPEIESVYGLGYVSENTKSYNLDMPDMMNFILKDMNGKIANVKGIYAEPTFSTDVEQSVSCTLKGSRGISRAGYPKLNYYSNFDALHTGTTLEKYDDRYNYYFRFEGETHHAGEYQNYLEYFYRCIEEGIIPKPDMKEGIRTLAVMEAMTLSMKDGCVVRVKDILSRRGLQ